MTCLCTVITCSMDNVPNFDPHATIKEPLAIFHELSLKVQVYLVSSNYSILINLFASIGTCLMFFKVRGDPL